MTEHPADSTGSGDENPPASWASSLDALRLAGAARRDPVRFRYIELLARRMADATPEVKMLLLSTLEQALAACEARVGEHRASEPPAPEDVTDTVDVAEAPVAAPLAALNRYIAVATAASVHADEYDLALSGWQPVDGLKNAGRFRASWRKLRAEDALGMALERAPESAGPLNSHRLVLHTLMLMQEWSPAYMRHFIEQAETLLWLDRASARFRQPASKPRQARAKG